MPHKIDKLGRLRMWDKHGAVIPRVERGEIARFFFNGETRGDLISIWKITEEDLDACIRKALKPTMEREDEDAE